MKRTITLGMLIAVLAAASGACDRGSDRPPSADAPARSSALPSAAASEQLAAAIAKPDGQSLKYTITGNQGTLSGGFDPTTRGITLSDGTTTKLAYVILDDDVYLKGFDPQGRWWHLSLSRFPSAKGDPAGATSVPFTAAVDSQGRLAGVKVTFTGVSRSGRLPYELTIVEYGATAPAVRPSRADTVEAPPEAYNA
jgi:hypothetical protein